MLAFLLLASVQEQLEVLVGALFAPYSSLCYLRDPSRDLNGLLSRIRSPLYVLSLSQLRAAPSLNCDCYLLDNANLSRIIDHLEGRRHNFLIRPHSTLWIIQMEAAALPPMFQPYGLNVLQLQLSRNGSEAQIYSNWRGRVVYRAQKALPSEQLLAAGQWRASDLLQFRKRPLSVSVFNCKPFMYLAGGQARGVEIQWINELLSQIPQKQLPVPSSENPWRDSLNSVQARDCDLAGCSQYALNLLKWNVDAVLSHIQACYTFLVPKARYLPEVTFLAQAFSWPVWTGLGLSLVGLGSLGVALGVWTAALAPTHVLRICAAGAAFTPAGPPLRTPVRLFLISSLFYGLLFDTYYTAGSSSILTRPRVVRVIDTFADMVRYNVSYQLQSPGIQRDFAALNSSTFSALAALYRRGDRRDTALDGAGALTVKNVGGTYITDLAGFPQDQLRHYRVLKECISNNYIGLAAMKNSPLTRRFNELTQKLTESGLILKWLRDEIQAERQSQRGFFTASESEMGFGMVTSGKLTGALVVLLLGHLAAAFCFTMELIVHCITHH